MNKRQFLKSASATQIAHLILPKPASAFVGREPLRNSVGLDLAVMRAAMDIHPGLYRFQSVGEAKMQFRSFEIEYLDACDKEDIRAAYLVVARYLATLQCGHSYPNFFNQKDSMVTALFTRQTRLPFWFRWIGSRMIITKDTQGLGLTPRSEVLAINGQPAAELLFRLLTYTRGDGSNNGKRCALLSVQGHEEYETFDIFQSLLAPPKADGLYRLVIRTPEGHTSIREVPAIDLDRRRKEMRRVPEDSDAPRWEWIERKDGICVLTMPGWAMWNSRWDWRNWLDERLDRLSAARGLIIDIRENEGGDDCGNPIISRLIDRPLLGWPFETRLRFTEMPELLKTHSTTWDQSFYKIGENAQPLGNGQWLPRNDEIQSAIEPSTKKINCPVAALISPTNSSATFSFINAARSSGKIRLFGETTGGNRRGVNGGAFLFVTLPFSGIEFDLPLKGYTPKTDQPDRGIDPDVEMRFDPSWIGLEKDPVVEMAAKWCLHDSDS